MFLKSKWETWPDDEDPKMLSDFKGHMKQNVWQLPGDARGLVM